jgi:hypothetical protein
MKSMHEPHITTTYNCERFEHFALLLSPLSDELRFHFLHFKGSALGAESSTGEVGDVLCDDAEEKSESEPSDSDELEDSTVTRRRWTIMMAEGWIQPNT